MRHFRQQDRGTLIKGKTKRLRLTLEWKQRAAHMNMKRLIFLDVKERITIPLSNVAHLTQWKVNRSGLFHTKNRATHENWIRLIVI